MTDEGRTRDKLVREGVPDHLHDGLIDYLWHGTRPGGFLQAVLENNLREAFARADDRSREGLFHLVSFLYNEAPLPAWGSPDRFASWRDHRGFQGLLEDLKVARD